MTELKKYLTELPENKQQWLVENFGNLDKFYVTVYLIIKNEHLTELEKPDRYEERLQVIKQVKKKLECILDGIGLNGEDVVADIASDYFEDYVQYKESYCPITNEEFVANIRKITNM